MNSPPPSAGGTSNECATRPPRGALPLLDETTAVVAAFDFDGTLTRGGSVFKFLVALKGLLPVAGVTATMLPRLAKAAVLGGVAADETKEALFKRLLVGVPVDEVERRSRTFARKHLEKHLRPAVVERMRWHQEHGHSVVIVSASPECYVKVAGSILGADAVIATRLAVGGGGMLTGGYEGKNCRGSEKYVRVAGWIRASELADARGTHPILWAYGNSRGDRRLLSAADVAVNAGRLGRFGSLRHFTRLSTLDEASGR